MYKSTLKITQDDYNKLNILIHDFMTAYKSELLNYSEIKESHPDCTVARYIWEVFNYTTAYLHKEQRSDDSHFLRRLYDYLNDNNLESALKNILKDKLQ